MNDNYSKRRRARNEVLFQRHNQEIQRLAKNVLAAAASDMPLRFVCECARADCIQTIEIPFEQYTAVTRNPRWFAIKPGHEQTDIEHVVRREKLYFVVEKFNDPPATPASP